MPLTPDAIFPEATVPPPDPAWMQPTIRGPMPVPPQALPVPTATYLAPQASVWPGVPGVWGQAARLPPGGLPPTGAPLPPGGLPPTGGLHLPVLQLLPGGLHPAMAPPTAPAHCWGHPLLAEVAGVVGTQWVWERKLALPHRGFSSFSRSDIQDRHPVRRRRHR